MTALDALRADLLAATVKRADWQRADDGVSDPCDDGAVKRVLDQIDAIRPDLRYLARAFVRHSRRAVARAFANQSTRVECEIVGAIEEALSA